MSESITAGYNNQDYSAVEIGIYSQRSKEYSRPDKGLKTPYLEGRAQQMFLYKL